MYWLALLNPDNKGKIYVLAHDESGVLQVWHTRKAALASFTDSYNRNHARSYEASMSACTHFMSFNPRVVKVKNVEDIEKQLIDLEDVSVVSLGHVSGYMDAVSATRKSALIMWEKGTVPALISE